VLKQGVRFHLFRANPILFFEGKKQINRRLKHDSSKRVEKEILTLYGKQSSNVDLYWLTGGQEFDFMFCACAVLGQPQVVDGV